MLDFLGNLERTQLCGTLSATDAGKQILDALGGSDKSAGNSGGPGK